LLLTNHERKTLAEMRAGASCRTRIDEQKLTIKFSASVQHKVPKARDLQRSSRLSELPDTLSTTLQKELWVRPNSNLRQQARRGDANITPMSGQRFLELADVALGMKKIAPPRKKPKSVPAATHLKRKTAPYSS
jgi:hypothetical protein